MGAAIGLDDEGGFAGGERRRLAGAALSTNDVGLPAKFVQSENAGGSVLLGVQSVQPESPGATTSMVRGPSWLKPRS